MKSRHYIKTSITASITALIAASMLIALLGAVSTLYAQQTTDAVATLSRKIGNANILKVADNRMIIGENGSLLVNDDTVITSKKSRVSIIFRDGTEVRMFENSNFVIKSDEVNSEKRIINHQLALREGSLQGSFPKKDIATKIRLPEANIIANDATLKAASTNGKASISLSSGQVEVSNLEGSYTLQQGYSLRSFGPSDKLHEKVERISTFIHLATETTDLTFEDGNSEEVIIAIRLLDRETNEEIFHSAPVYLYSNYDNIDYPPEIQLDARGSALTAIRIKKPAKVNRTENLNIFIWCVIEDENFDALAGKLLLRYPAQNDIKRVIVD